MEDRNNSPAPALRRAIRRQGERAWKRHNQLHSGIPFGGVIVTATLVRQHRYRRDHGLPHSPNVAAVLLPRRRGTFSTLDLASFLALAAMAYAIKQQKRKR